jgi:hypothetical protein
VNSMMAVLLLIAGAGLLLAGLLAIGFGIPVKEFSFGNTLILTGVIAACTGMMLLGLWIVIREMKNIAQRLGIPGTSALQSAAGRDARENEGLLFGRDGPVQENPGRADPAAPSSGSSAPWQDEAGTRDRIRGDASAVAEPVEAVPAVKPKRNLMFSSSSRKERERAQERTDPPMADPQPEPAVAAPVPALAEAPPASFDDAWPMPERSRAVDVAPPRRADRTPSTFAAAGPATAADRYPPAPRNEDPPQVTVLKSGVVDGMAYSLYSDGSIEAQMPEGMMRFASIDELRAHLDHRP